MPCDKCFKECGKIFQDDLVFVFCDHNHAGGVFDIKGEKWHFYYPVTKQEFDNILKYSLAFYRILRMQQKKQVEKELAAKPVFH